MTALNIVRRFPHTCDEEVTRKGELQPCEKTAVAVRIDPTEGSGYPAPQQADRFDDPGFALEDRALDQCRHMGAEDDYADWVMGDGDR